MGKIIQLAVALNSDGDESLYALTDEGQVLQRRWAAPPYIRDRYGSSPIYGNGCTEGWVTVEDCPSVPVKHPDDKREA